MRIPFKTPPSFLKPPTFLLHKPLSSSSTLKPLPIYFTLKHKSTFSSTTHFKPSQSQNRKLATMATAPIGGHSEACCNTIPVVTTGYKEKGKYETVGGLKTYVTGPADATKAILFIYDIFGYFPQTLQGADILATGDHSNKYQVFIPDWFEGKPADISWYPPTDPEKQAALGNFFGTTGAPPTTAAKVPGFVKSIKAAYPNIKDIGIVGFCWGGKIVSITSGTDTPFKVAAECHPAMVDPSEAIGITIPVIMLASGDEDKEAVEAFKNNLKGEKHVEVYGDQVHGWMAARADLESERVKGEYIRGYKALIDFFGKHL